MRLGKKFLVSAFWFILSSYWVSLQLFSKDQAAPVSQPLWGRSEYLLLSFSLMVFLFIIYRAWGYTLRKQKQKWQSLTRQQIDELTAVKEKAEAGMRLRSQFLANMSHEIRTPLNGIIGMVDLTLESELTDVQRSNLDLVKYSAHELLTIVNDILDFSKIESGHLELEYLDFCITSRVKEVIRLLAVHAHKKGIQLKYYIQPEIPALLNGDPVRLSQIMINLLGNAIKFTEKGEVLLTVEIDSRKKSIDNTESVPLRFSVSDTGIGIPETHREIVFQAFSQADISTCRKYGGTGLGLAISSRLVENMAGHLEIASPTNRSHPCFNHDNEGDDMLLPGAQDSNGGPGTTFSFSIPLKKAAQSAAIENLVDIGRLKDVPVLIIQEDNAEREMLENLFSRWGMHPVSTDCESTALSHLKNAAQENKPFKLILLEKEFSQFDGFEFAYKLKNLPEQKQTQIIMLSTWGHGNDPERCKHAGISEYLARPFEPVHLMKALRRMFVNCGSCLESKKESSPHATMENQRKLNCLVAEDNKVNQKLVKGMLMKHGHTVTIAENGKEVLEKLNHHSHCYDIIFMDIQMPELGGVETTHAIREKEKCDHRDGHRKRHIPIIALTAFAMKGDRERFLDAGMDAYISKPIQMKDLTSAIQCVTPLMEERRNC